MLLSLTLPWQRRWRSLLSMLVLHFSVRLIALVALLNSASACEVVSRSAVSVVAPAVALMSSILSSVGAAAAAMVALLRWSLVGLPSRLSRLVWHPERAMLRVGVRTSGARARGKVSVA